MNWFKPKKVKEQEEKQKLTEKVNKYNSIYAGIIGKHCMARKDIFILEKFTVTEKKGVTVNIIRVDTPKQHTNIFSISDWFWIYGDTDFLQFHRDFNTYVSELPRIGLNLISIENFKDE